jgi:serine/threonine protein kinase
MKNENMKNEKGGKVLASGGYGCVFSPALICEGESKRSIGKISKLMTEKHARDEYEEINIIKTKLDSIKNYKDYFLLYDATLCKPDKLTDTDLKNFKKCTALPKDDITKKNINSNIDKIMALNMPNGGLDVDDYLYDNGSLEKIYQLHISLVKLLEKGIVPMNEKNIYHCDIKDSNVLVDSSLSELKTRLIDWGLSTEYIPFENNPFPKTWRNRPLQFNVPFSVIIFSDSFVEKYMKFIKHGGVPEETHLKPFVIDYISFWMKERGAGHYKFINEIMFNLFSKNLESISSSSKPPVIETQITMDYIVNYIVDVLIHFTKFRQDGTLNLRDYLDNVFIKIVDIWGFINIYYPIIELFSNNYSSLNSNEINIFNKIKFIFVKYLYSPRHEPINMNILYYDLKDLGILIDIALREKKITRSNTSFEKASGIHKNIKKSYIKRKTSSIKRKTSSIKRKTSSIKRKTISFKRKPKQKRFQNPFFLSIK